MSLLLLLLATACALGVWVTHSLLLAYALVGMTMLTWLLFETFAVTIFAHRHVTHGSWEPTVSKGKFIRFWLWWTRSGGVKYWEWVTNHAWHHWQTDTNKDSYTPWETNVLTGQRPLSAPRPWNFWDNAASYRRFSVWISEHPEALLEMTQTDVNAANTMKRLKDLDWARPVYDRTTRALFINSLLFTVVSGPLALQARTWWQSLLVIVVLPWIMTGVKVILYLVGGYIINYYGHQSANNKAHQSNIPALLMLLTLAMLGEGWHELHHDAPWSARFHERLDPAWWIMVGCMRTGWILSKATLVAERTDTPRVYRQRWYTPA